MKRSAARRVPALWGLTLLTLLGMASVGGYVVHRLLRAERPTFTLADARGAARVGRAGRSDGVFRLAGSGSNIPLMRVLVRAFAGAGDPEPIMVHRSIGSTGGVRALRDGAIDLAMISRPLDPAERGADWVVLPYARVAVVVAAHPGVPVDGLTAAELLAVYGGQPQSVVPEGRLALLLRERGDSSHLAMARWVPDFGAVDEAAHRARRGRVVYSDLEMQTALIDTEGAIGLFDLGAIRAQNLPIKVLALDGVTPSVASLESGDYPVHKDLALVARRGVAGRAAAFLRFLGSEAGQQTIRDAGYLPLTPPDLPPSSEAP